MEIYKRQYDNPIGMNGNKKPNKLLGEFKIIETIFEDAYDSQRIGIKEGLVYLITETEVKGYNGGSRFEVAKLESVTAKGFFL